MPGSPIDSPLGGSDKVSMGRMALDVQERALETLVEPLLVHAEEAISAQEDMLKKVVTTLIKNAKKRVAKQQSQLDQVIDELIANARTKVSTQAAQLVGVTSGEGLIETRNGGGQVPIGQTNDLNGNGDPPPPPPGDEEWCHALVHYNGWYFCREVYRRYAPQLWGPRQDPVCGFATELEAIAAVERAYPDLNYCPNPPPQPPEPPTIRFPERVRIERPISGEPPPEPPPPPPPIMTPPPTIIEGEIVVPPPTSDPECDPRDPCFPAPLTLVGREIYSATPYYPYYWARARCVDRCRAEIECYSGDCPPRNDDGWQWFGPYAGCLSQHEKELIVRTCLNSNGNGDPPDMIPGSFDRPDWVEPPPQPPTEPPINPPPGECPQPKPVRPELRVNEYVPVCRTLEQWGGKAVQDLGHFASVEDIDRWVADNHPDEVTVPDLGEP